MRKSSRRRVRVNPPGVFFCADSEYSIPSSAILKQKVVHISRNQHHREIITRDVNSLG